MTAETPPRRGRGGRPKGDPAAVRVSTIGVRVSAGEYADLRAKAEQMGMTPGAVAAGGCAIAPPAFAARAAHQPRAVRRAGEVVRQPQPVGARREYRPERGRK